MTPREPHLLARGVERDRQAREHPVAGAQRRLLQEHPRLGVDERGGRTVRHRDALRHARGEDDPRVVFGAGKAGVARRDCRLGFFALREEIDGILTACGHEGSGARDDPRHAGLAEDELRALLGVVRVDGHVRGSRGHDPEDRDVQLA